MNGADFFCCQNMICLLTTRVPAMYCFNSNISMQCLERKEEREESWLSTKILQQEKKTVNLAVHALWSPEDITSAREGYRSQHFCPEMQLLGKKNKHGVKNLLFYYFFFLILRLANEELWWEAVGKVRKERGNSISECCTTAVPKFETCRKETQGFLGPIEKE